MDRFWSLLFLAVPILGTVIVLGAAFDIGFQDRWLPESIGPRTEGTDYLFDMIHVILGIVFLFTGLVLAYSLWRFRAGNRELASNRSGNTLLEILWTTIPAVILIFLALHQLPYWRANKELHPLFTITEGQRENFQPPNARVVAFQYGWRFVSPGKDLRFDTIDDIVSENRMVLPAGEELVIELVSEDVIHSFAINQLRLKQDIVPGLTPRIWFQINEPGEWEINCMELCGWGHYRMKARLQVLSPADFEAWKSSVLNERGY